VWVQLLNLDPSTKIVLTAIALWVTLVIAAAGPVASALVINFVRYQDIKFMQHQMRKRLKAMSEDESNSENLEKAQASIRELDAALTEILQDSSNSFRITPMR
jgi:predicted PurR-regulated permease PerM